MIDEINAQLALDAMQQAGTIEPCDEKDAHALDWCEVVSVDLFDEIYHWTPEEAY